MKKPPLTLLQDSVRRQSPGLTQASSGCLPASEARQRKIASLARAVRNNVYRIDHRKLADCLIASLLLGLLR